MLILHKKSVMPGIFANYYFVVVHGETLVLYRLELSSEYELHTFYRYGILSDTFVPVRVRYNRCGDLITWL